MRDERFPDCEYAEETENPGIVHCTEEIKLKYPHVSACQNCDGRRIEKPDRSGSECRHLGEDHDSRPCMSWCKENEVWIKSTKCEYRDCFNPKEPINL